MTATSPHVDGLCEWRPLARGGLAEVWQAREQSLDRPVAVKVYARGLNEADRRHFLREVAAAGRLAAHPGIVTTYFAGVLPDDRPYIVMELCPGGSLSAWLKPERRHSQEQVRQVGLRVADTLAAAHAAGVLHRDVKPGNILLDAGGRPRLADFGSAVRRGADEGPPDAVWMTPAWAPPEAFLGEPATEAGDVYSLAATLYALLSGHPPRTVGPASAPLEELAELARTPVPRLPGVARPLMDVLLAALDPEPTARPSAAAFFEELAQVPLHVPKPAAAVPAQAPAEEPRPRRRRAGVLVLVAALAVVVASVSVWLGRVPTSSGAAPAPAPASLAGPPPSPTPGGRTPTAAAVPAAAAIRVTRPPDAAKAFRAARIEGLYAGRSGTLLQVQRWEEGAWLAFPVPTMTDQAGQFTAYVELDQPGRYRLRVQDPRSGTTSDPVELVVSR